MAALVMAADAVISSRSEVNFLNEKFMLFDFAVDSSSSQTSPKESTLCSATAALSTLLWCDLQLHR